MDAFWHDPNIVCLLKMATFGFEKICLLSSNRCRTQEKAEILPLSAMNLKTGWVKQFISKLFVAWECWFFTGAEMFNRTFCDSENVFYLQYTTQ